MYEFSRVLLETYLDMERKNFSQNKQYYLDSKWNVLHEFQEFF